MILYCLMKVRNPLLTLPYAIYIIHASWSTQCSVSKQKIKFCREAWVEVLWLRLQSMLGRSGIICQRCSHLWAIMRVWYSRSTPSLGTSLIKSQINCDNSWPTSCYNRDQYDYLVSTTACKTHSLPHKSLPHFKC